MAKGEKQEPVTDAQKNREIARWMGWTGLNIPALEGFGVPPTPNNLYTYRAPYHATFDSHQPKRDFYALNIFTDLRFLFAAGGPIEKLREHNDTEFMFDLIKEALAWWLAGNISTFAAAVRDAVHAVTKEKENENRSN